jgi:glycosyltransferase involved in cell wall biosynthesis
MRLDIIVATFNRADLLRECLESFLRAAGAVDWRVSVVDNNSSDHTRQVVESFMARSPRVRYLWELRQGRSAALNCGINASDYDLIGMIDDDEQIGEHWMEVASQWFRDPAIDFIGGPSFGNWQVKRPDWIPPGYEGVLSVDDPDRIPRAPIRFPDPRIFLRGGNAVMRRSVFERIGAYGVELGRSASGLASCEDHDIYLRLMAAGMTGYYVPDLIMYHVVPPERVTRSYFRKWAWGQARSLAIMDRRNPQNIAYFGKIPRYRIGMAVRQLPALVGRNHARRFAAELQWWTLGGFAWEAYARNRSRFRAS